MEQVTTGMFLTEKDEEQYNSWTKEQIYIAYILEEDMRKKLTEERNELQRKLAEIRFLTR